MYNFQALQILIFLIPGFISAIILDALVVRPEKKELGKIIEALIFSMIIYTIYSPISGKSPISLIKIKESTALVYDSNSFLWLALISLFIPLFLSFFITNDLLMKLARKLRITMKTARASVWLDVFSDLDKHIIINFENGQRIYGWPMYHSSKPENPHIYLFNPAWIQEDEFVDLNIEGILITPKQKIESIEFLKE